MHHIKLEEKKFTKSMDKVGLPPPFMCIHVWAWKK
jgi:hypothetical protein